MESRLQRRIQRYGWDAASQYYDNAWASQLRPTHDALLKIASLHPGARVLEIACGTGLVTMRIADAVLPGGSVFATDIAGEMVTETAKQAILRGFDNVEAARMEAENLPLDDDSFDVAICALGLMYIPDPVKGLEEMCRVVKPGGVVAVTVWGERRNCGWADIFPIIDAHVKSEVCPLFFSMGAPNALANAMESAGLGRIEQTRHTVNMLFPDHGSLLHAPIAGGPVALAAKRFSRETREEVDAAFLASVSDYRQEDGSYRIPGEFVSAVGRS
jgi:ubiquinone/menaquinone biosynthesis C-methylase UbiE